MAAYSSGSQMSSSHSSTWFIGEEINLLIEQALETSGSTNKVPRLLGDVDKKAFALIDQAFNSSRPLKTFVLQDCVADALVFQYSSEELKLYEHAIIKHLKTKNLDSLVTLDLSGLDTEEYSSAMGDAIDVIAKCKFLTTLRINKFVTGRPILYSSMTIIGDGKKLVEKQFNDPKNVYSTFDLTEEGSRWPQYTATVRRELNAKGHKGNPDLRELSQAMRSLPHLTSLSMRDNGIGTAEALEKLELNRFPALRHLELSKNYFDDNSFAKIAEIFSTNTMIVDLDLSECELSQDKLSFLGHMLKTNTTLEVLRLRQMWDMQNGIRGLEHLASALAVNNTIRVLDLTGHVIPSRDFVSFFEAAERDDSPLESLGDQILFGFHPETIEADTIFVEEKLGGRKLSVFLKTRNAERAQKMQRLN